MSPRIRGLAICGPGTFDNKYETHLYGYKREIVFLVNAPPRSLKSPLYFGPATVHRSERLTPSLPPPRSPSDPSVLLWTSKWTHLSLCCEMVRHFLWRCETWKIIKLKVRLSRWHWKMFIVKRSSKRGHLLLEIRDQRILSIFSNFLAESKNAFCWIKDVGPSKYENNVDYENRANLIFHTGLATPLQAETN